MLDQSCTSQSSAFMVACLFRAIKPPCSGKGDIQFPHQASKKKRDHLFVCFENSYCCSLSNLSFMMLWG